MLRSIAETGIFDIRSKIGQQFTRQHRHGEDKDKYEACKTRHDKAEFRAAWARAKYKYVLQEKSFTQDHDKIESYMCERMTFGSLVRHYGGWTWAPAVEGAKIHAAKCCALGGVWATTCEWSGLELFTVMKEQWGDTFSQRWREFQREYSEVMTQASPDNDASALADSSTATAGDGVAGASSEQGPSVEPAPTGSDDAAALTRGTPPRTKRGRVDAGSDGSNKRGKIDPASVNNNDAKANATTAPAIKLKEALRVKSQLC